jgi:MoxR-like ATPase
MAQITPCASPEDIAAAQKEMKTVEIAPELIKYIAKIVGATREHPDTASGASPRGTLMLMRASQAMAYLDGRAYVIPEDIKALAEPVLAHRLLLLGNYGSIRSGNEIVRDILRGITVPTENFGR